MLLQGKCTKCDCLVSLDIGDKTKEEAIEGVRQWGTFHCVGHHLELCSPYPKYWNMDEWLLAEGKAPTEEEFVADLKSKYEYVIDTEEMTKLNIIKGFSYGFPITNDGKNWSFDHSPKGKRWYYTGGR